MNGKNPRFEKRENSEYDISEETEEWLKERMKTHCSEDYQKYRPKHKKTRKERRISRSTKKRKSD